MNSKKLLLACVLSVSAFTHNAYSQESKICSNALQTICTDTKVERAANQKNIEAIKKEISEVASAAAAPRIEVMKNENKGIRKFLKRLFSSMSIMNQEIMKAAKTRIGGIESLVNDPNNVALIKNNLKQAIDESNFNEATREKFKEKVDSIVVGNFGNFIEKIEASAQEGQRMPNYCGSDGMTENAFAVVINKENYVLICPAFLITLSQTENDQEKLSKLIMLLTHEMGHHFDDRSFGRRTYESYLSCIADNYSSNLNKSKDDAKFCKEMAKKKYDSKICDTRVVTSHMSELIADQWAIKALAVYAKNQQKSVSEFDSLLVANWSGLCGTKDEGIHPTGDFRIGTLLRINQEISDQLSCNNTEVKTPACSFDGAINL